MKNKDMPAIPSKVSFNRQRTERLPYQFGDDDFVEPGLTKREYAAIKIMAGLLSASLANNIGASDECLSHWSITAADALFDKLEADE